MKPKVLVPYHQQQKNGQRDAFLGLYFCRQQSLTTGFEKRNMRIINCLVKLQVPRQLKTFYCILLSLAHNEYSDCVLSKGEQFF